MDTTPTSAPAGTPARNDKNLTPEEARRALYVDFEGRKDQPPVLLGCARRSRHDKLDRVWQTVTDLPFAPLADADGIESMPLAAAVERILLRAEKNDRRIVAWTEHELNVVREHCPKHLDRFEARYVNARTFAVRWRNTCHDGSKPETSTLADYLALIGWDVPDSAGRGRTGETIGILEDALERHGSVDRLTENQRNRWRNLRDHNRHDCAGMREICLMAAREIAERVARS